MLIKNPLIVMSSGGGDIALNIEYGLTEPTDHSKLWVKCAQPENILFDKYIVQTGANCTTLTPTLAYGMYGTSACSVGTDCYIFGGNADSYKNIIQKFMTGAQVLELNHAQVRLLLKYEQTGCLINNESIQYKLYGMMFYLGNSDNHAELIESMYYDETAQAWVSTN